MKALAGLGSIRHYGVLAQDTDGDFEPVKLNFSHCCSEARDAPQTHKAKLAAEYIITRMMDEESFGKIAERVGRSHIIMSRYLKIHEIWGLLNKNKSSSIAVFIME